MMERKRSSSSRFDCSTLSNSGALRSRESATWVDLSRPGEAPTYARQGGGTVTDTADDTGAAGDDDEAGGEPESSDDGAAPVDDAPGQLSDE